MSVQERYTNNTTDSRRYFIHARHLIYNCPIDLSGQFSLEYLSMNMLCVQTSHQAFSVHLPIHAYMWVLVNHSSKYNYKHNHCGLCSSVFVKSAQSHRLFLRKMLQCIHHNPVSNLHHYLKTHPGINSEVYELYFQTKIILHLK